LIEGETEGVFEEEAVLDFVDAETDELVKEGLLFVEPALPLLQETRPSKGSKTSVYLFFMNLPPSKRIRISIS